MLTQLELAKLLDILATTLEREKEATIISWGAGWFVHKLWFAWKTKFREVAWLCVTVSVNIGTSTVWVSALVTV